MLRLEALNWFTLIKTISNTKIVTLHTFTQKYSVHYSTIPVCISKNNTGIDLNKFCVR